MKKRSTTLRGRSMASRGGGRRQTIVRAAAKRVRSGGARAKSATTSSHKSSSRRSSARTAQRSTETRSSARAGGKSSRSRGSANTTFDHEEIRRWVEERGGHPATVKGTIRGKQSAGVIRIDFPGYSGGQSLKPISWDEWFEIFDERKLGFLHQDRTANGKPSRFNKLVARK